MNCNARILIIDDEPAMRRVIARILEGAGHDVDSVGDASIAAAMVARGSYDLVVSDVCMPSTDGITMLRQLRATDADLPVVLLSGSVDVAMAMAAVELNAFRFLSKPVDASLLRETVAQAIAAGSQARGRRQDAAQVATRRVETQQRSVTFDGAMDGLWVAYQPIVRARDGGLHAYEALVRTTEASLASPLALFAIAEELGRTSDISRAVRSRCADPFLGAAADAQLFVNLHTLDLQDEALYDPDSPLAQVADRVVLEVTERASMTDLTDVRPRLARLRKLGFRIAIDDLGAGYAGLTAFALLEPDVVKLDMSIVRDVHESTTKQRLIHSITRLASELGFQVVAEGVERSEERDALVSLGCDLLQGYLFARPGPAFPKVTWPLRAQDARPALRAAS